MNKLKKKNYNIAVSIIVTMLYHYSGSDFT